MSREARTIIALEAIAGTKLAEASDLAVSVRVLFGAGAGMGAGLFFAHWQGALGPFFPLWQQQHSRLDRDFPQQQQAVPFRQHAALLPESHVRWQHRPSNHSPTSAWPLPESAKRPATPGLAQR